MCVKVKDARHPGFLKHLEDASLFVFLLDISPQIDRAEGSRAQGMWTMLKLPFSASSVDLIYIGHGLMPFICHLLID